MKTKTGLSEEWQTLLQNEKRACPPKRVKKGASTPLDYVKFKNKQNIKEEKWIIASTP